MTAQDDRDSSGANPVNPTETECSYEAFGRNFFERVVTRDRIASALSDLQGNKIDFGPKSAGPVGLARVEAHGSIGDVAVERMDGEKVRFNVTVPVAVELTVTLAGQSHRFNAQVRANVRLTALALEPLRIFIDVTPPGKDDVKVDVESHGLRASILNIVAGIDGELRRVVAKYIAREIDRPEIRKMREIDVAARIDKAYA